jgi:hypothetical protein
VLGDCLLVFYKNSIAFAQESEILIVQEPTGRAPATRLTNGCPVPPTAFSNPTARPICCQRHNTIAEAS